MLNVNVNLITVKSLLFVNLNQIHTQHYNVAYIIPVRRPVKGYKPTDMFVVSCHYDLE